MGFEPTDERKEQNTVETQFEGGGVDMESGDLTAASPVAAPRRTLRERRAVRARAVDPSAQTGRTPGASQSARRAGAAGAPPIRKPLMRSNSEFGYLFSDTEPMDNHMDETYSQRLNGLAYDGKKRGDESEYAELFEGQQSMVRRPENRMSAPVSSYSAQPAAQEGPAENGRRPRFSRRSRENSSAAAYAAANEISAAELAARTEPEAAPVPVPQPDEPPYGSQDNPLYAGSGEGDYPRDSRYEDDYYDYRDRSGRRDPRGGYEPQPEYPPYGYPPAAYPPGYYPYPYGQYPGYSPYGQYPGYPPYGYPPAAYPPGYPYPGQPQDVRPARDPAAAGEPVAAPSLSRREPKPGRPLPIPADPRPTIIFPDDSSDSVDEEFAGLEYTPSGSFEKKPEPEKVEKPEKPAEPKAQEPAAPAASETDRSAGNSRFNRRSRSVEEPADSEPTVAMPAPAPEVKPSPQDSPSGDENPRRRFSRRSSEAYDWSDSSSPAKDTTDWFSSDESATDISQAGISSRFNRRSRN